MKVMMQEEKELLLKELCGRLPYGITCHANEINLDGELLFINKVYNIVAIYNDKATGKFDTCPIADIKPYLRPMSSMTEEEKEELKNLFDAEEVTSDFICYLEGGTLEEYLSHISYSFCSGIIDWLNAHHFDYRGLIEKGLAIAVTEENNPYNDLKIK